MTPIEKLRELALEAASVSSAASVLGWDQETYLPASANAWRSMQLAWLSGRSHEIVTSAAWKEALEAALDDLPDDPRARGNLLEMKRRFDRATRIPTGLVERESELASRSKHAWAAARKASDFAAFAPFLHELLDLAREKAELWGYPDEPYDALLEDYEPGATTASVGGALDALGPRLAPLAQAAVERSAQRPIRLPEAPYPVAAQMQFNERIARSIGFDFDRGRIDTTTHPFCTTLGPADVRLTTRYDETDFTSSLFGVLHEAGHGLYEQGLPADDFGWPAGQAASLGIHESQSRLWENHVGRSRRFWETWFPVAVDHFPQLSALGLDDFLAYVHRAERSFIRVEADEATYDLHILLRFDLERRLVRGDLAVNDIPAAWNESFRERFGITPPDDAHGCLQDIHWSMGGLGYFPTYTLGNLNSAQLFEAARSESSIAGAIDSADYGPLLGWLREKVHALGATMPADEIVHHATGHPPSPEAHLEHLKVRYLTPED